MKQKLKQAFSRGQLLEILAGIERFEPKSMEHIHRKNLKFIFTRTYQSREVITKEYYKNFASFNDPDIAKSMTVEQMYIPELKPEQKRKLKRLKLE